MPPQSRCSRCGAFTSVKPGRACPRHQPVSGNPRAWRGQDRSTCAGSGKPTVTLEKGRFR